MLTSIKAITILSIAGLGFFLNGIGGAVAMLIWAAMIIGAYRLYTKLRNN